MFAQPSMSKYSNLVWSVYDVAQPYHIRHKAYQLVRNSDNLFVYHIKYDTFICYIEIYAFNISPITTHGEIFIGLSSLNINPWTKASAIKTYPWVLHKHLKPSKPQCLVLRKALHLFLDIGKLCMPRSYCTIVQSDLGMHSLSTPDLILQLHRSTLLQNRDLASDVYIWPQDSFSMKQLMLIAECTSFTSLK